MTEFAGRIPNNPLLDTVLRFAACCRSSGLRISTAEILDTVNQLRLIDPGDENTFKTLLGANFVKTRRDRPRFETLYQLFFHDVQADPVTGKEKSADIEARNTAAEIRDLLAEANQDLLQAALLDFLAGDPRPYLQFLQTLARPQETRQIPLRSNLGELSRRLEIMLKINTLRCRARELVENRLADDPATREAVDAHFQVLLDRAYDLLRNDPQPDNVGLQENQSTENRLPDLGGKPLANLTAAEIDSIRDIIDRLVNKLKDAVSRRQAVRRRGKLDVKATLRRAHRFQGVPLDIVYKNRPPRKGKIVTLCDVSGSVWSTARFMLSVLHALQDCFSGVKSFVFVAGVAEVTDLFQDHDINPAIDRIFTNTRLETEVPTDYGETFLRFRENHLAALTRHTTLIIIGDGRSNYMNPRGDVLEEMRERCRRIIWLNPEPLISWDTGDSDMRLFRNHCHEIRPCQNLNQLWTFVEELVL